MKTLKAWKWSIAFSCFFLLVGCSTEVNEQEIMAQYDQILIASSELFRYHVKEEDSYYNEQYQTVGEVYSLLEDIMTDEAVEQLINSIFIREDNRLFYNNHFTGYLEEANFFSIEQNDMSDFYVAVRESIVNPGLRMLHMDQLTLEQRGSTITVNGSNVPVYFYEEDDLYSSQYYGLLGYPSQDYLTFSFSFIKKGDKLKMNDYEITAF
ncbi:hypothetical protein [Halalkalibacterium ligniniphilum]|uniref:hypothetical protein n=1 Tax=Halalkalibacterium ligniniphilum TaxID=1134413 RepID=UPI000345CF4E|nr:hypothetical protein [Halalkalibacterium ligniniphilum]